MSARLATLVAQYEKTDRSIERELIRLRRTCKHERFIKAETDHGYLFMCQRCYGETRGWYLKVPGVPYVSAASVPSISRQDFFDRRPPGELHRLDQERAA